MFVHTLSEGSLWVWLVLIAVGVVMYRYLGTLDDVQYECSVEDALILTVLERATKYVSERDIYRALRMRGNLESVTARLNILIGFGYVEWWGQPRHATRVGGRVYRITSRGKVKLREARTRRTARRGAERDVTIDNERHMARAQARAFFSAC